MNCCLMTVGKYACREGHAAAAGEGDRFPAPGAKSGAPRRGCAEAAGMAGNDFAAFGWAGKRARAIRAQEVTASHAYRQDQALHKGKTYAIILFVPCDGREMERCPSGRRCLTRNQVWRITTVGSNPTLSASESKRGCCTYQQRVAAPFSLQKNVAKDLKILGNRRKI